MKMRKIIGIIIVTLMIGIVVLPVLDSEEKEFNFSISRSGGWIKHFEGTSWAYVIRQVDDGYVLVGATDVDDFGDGLVMKVDNSGNEIWRKTFPNGAFEGLWITSDNGYIVSGWRKELPIYKGLMVKLDKEGNVEWEKTYGGPVCLLVQCQETADGGYISGGFFQFSGNNNDAWLLKTDAEGNELWNKTYGTATTMDIFHSVRQTSDNGFILTGWNWNKSNKYSDGYIVKTDADGNIEWEKNLGTGNDIFGIDKFDQLNMGKPAPHGGYIFTGYTASNFLHYYFFAGCSVRLVKTDAECNVEWDKTYGNPWFFDWGLWIEPTSDGGYITCGFRNGYGRMINIIRTGDGKLLSCQLSVIKTDSEGNMEWECRYTDATARCVQETVDGGYIIAGNKGHYYGTKGILLIKTDENGNIN
jgi:hypothetical protein